MDKIIEYISVNYTWILAGIILILLAIIGRYAEATNFGSKELEEKKKKQKKEEVEQIEEQQPEEVQPKEEPEEAEKEEVKVEEPQQNEQEVVEEATNEKRSKELEQKLDSLDKEFDSFIPKKDLISGDLLNEIDSLSLDKTQKISLTDIPDLDDVELPKIKDLTKKDDDIWKF